MANVLIIDDDETFSYVLKRACTRHHYDVTRVSSLSGAMQAVRGKVFDVAFLDISLPDGNGLSLLPALLEGRDHPEVIVVTGYDSTDWVEKALKAGAWDFIQKSDELGTILEALSRLCSITEITAPRLFPPDGRKRCDGRTSSVPVRPWSAASTCWPTARTAA